MSAATAVERRRRLRHPARGTGQSAGGHARRHRPRGLDGQHRRSLSGGRGRDPGRQLHRCRRHLVAPRWWPRSSTRPSSARAPTIFRFWSSSFPQIAAGPEGEVYVAYVGRPSDKPDDDGDVYLTSSLDDGQTWSRPKVLNADDTDHVQMFPSIDVGPDGVGACHVGRLPRQPQPERYNIYYTRSDDRGETFGFDQRRAGHHRG